MSQEEWVEYFEAVNGRKPSAEEFKEAKESGTFRVAVEKAPTSAPIAATTEKESDHTWYWFFVIAGSGSLIFVTIFFLLGWFVFQLPANVQENPNGNVAASSLAVFLVAGIFAILAFLGWKASQKQGTPNEKYWRLFLLITGIIWIVLNLIPSSPSSSPSGPSNPFNGFIGFMSWLCSISWIIAYFVKS